MDVGLSPSLVSCVDANMLSLAQGLFTSLPSSTSFVSTAVTSSSYRPQNVFGHISPISSVSDSPASSTLPYATPSLDEVLPLLIDLSPSSSPPYIDSTPFSRYPLADSPSSSLLSSTPPSAVPPSQDVDVVSLHAGDASFLANRLLLRFLLLMLLFFLYSFASYFILFFVLNSFVFQPVTAVLQGCQTSQGSFFLFFQTLLRCSFEIS